MSTPDLSLDTARALILYAQGLLQPHREPAVKDDVLAAIDRIALLQIDTINVVARAPYMALFSRLGAYTPAWLDELLAEGRIFEYWAHAACFIPIEQYPYHRRLMLENARFHHYRAWYDDHKTDADIILKHVQEHGAVRSADFERKDGKRGTWWDWKIEKDALENWFAAGELMIARREKFQRVYDLRERVYPAWSDDRAASLDETIRYFTLRSVQALGVAQPGWVADYYRLPKAQVSQAIRELLAAGEIVEINVEGWPEPALITGTAKKLLIENPAALVPTHTTLLAPFDALIWDRKRAKVLFDFDFSIECYLPAAKRKYGYYLLPVLHRGRLVARLDAKAHRKEGIFEVKSFYWEPGLKVEDEMLSTVRAAIQRCADWHGTPTLLLPDSFASAA